MKILFLFIISCSWLFSQIVRMQFGNGLSINVLDLSIGIIAIVILAWFAYKKKLHLFFRDNIGKGIAIFSSIIMFSLLWNKPSLNSQQFIVSSLYIVRWISYAVLFLFIRRCVPNDKKLIQKAMLFTGIFFVVIGYIQFFYYSELKNLFYLGWDKHMYRLFSTFLDPNFTGIFLALFLLFIVGKRLEMPLFPLTKTKLALSILLACTAGGLILTFSRSSFITLFFEFIVFFSLIGKKRWIAMLFGIMVIIGIILSQRFYIENINLFRTFSSNARLMSMSQALEMFYKQPVLGVGFNSYRYAQLRLGFREQKNIETSHADSGTDNSFLFVLATTGIVGFAVYLSMLFSILLRVYKVFREKKSVSLAVVFSSIIGLSIASMFINALFFPPLMLWMWVLLGVTEKN